MALDLTDIYNQKIIKGIALTKLAKWYDKVEKLDPKFFKTVVETMKNHYDTIVNFFVNRSTNASAESFNAIKNAGNKSPAKRGPRAHGGAILGLRTIRELNPTNASNKFALL